MLRNPFYGAPSQNGGQFLPCQIPLQNSGHYPEIVGEGDVTSVMLPNGSVQYMFIPTFKRDIWTAYAYNPNAMNVNLISTSEAWIPSYCLSQQLSTAFGDQFLRSTFPTDVNVNAPPLGFRNKFHYDNWTSTTDLQYFYPSLRYPNRPQKSCASVQIDTPTTVCHYEVVCGKPCHCAIANGSNPVECCMSVEEVNETVRTKPSNLKEDVKKVNTIDSCECSNCTKTSDKIVSTCNDQASGASERLQIKKSTINRKNDDSPTNSQHSKTQKRKNVRSKTPPIVLTGVCNGGCCCNSSCITTEEEI